ncbi:MAG: tetratricopeptide repeat protein, partial [Acidobacteriota bacterium]|nr:tetratricopeptide repeat protein [Acidobacteriota bacterium]
LADGLSENLINTLSRLPQLKVIARSSSFKYRGENIDIQDAARKLGVGAILTGRVVRRVDDLQISVELINAADNTRIWGDIYNRKVSAALSVQEEIAHAVSEKLQLNLSGAQERQMAKQITDNPQAYQSYMNGVFFRRKNGAENIRKAIEYQKQAIALDPSFVRAYTELAINFTILVEIAALSPKEGMPQARAAAEKALALDETLAEAHYTLARVRDFEFDPTGAESAFKRAIELNPNLAGAHTLYAEYLSRSGRFDEALREVKLAQELDPLRTGLIGNEGLILYHARRYDEAIAKKQIHAHLAAENPFAHLELANAYVQKGQYAEAILAYQTSIKLEETTSALIYFGRVYALSGKRNEATAVLDKLKTTEKYVSPTELAILYAALGDKEKAFASLEKAFTERDFQLASLKVEPGYDPLRDDPRFQDLMRRIGFPQ